MRRAALLALSLAWGLALCPGSSSAGFLSGLRLPASYRSWTIDPPGSGKATVSQLYLPVTASLRMGTHADLVLSTAAGLASVKPDSGETFNLNGPADVTGQVFLRLAADRLLIQAGVNLPTGKRELDAEQLSVARALGNPLLGFRLKQYGQGLDLNGGAALAFPLGGSAALGLGGGFLHHGSYTLTASGGDYEPGSELSLSGGLDLGSREGTGPGALLRLDATHRLFAKDRLGSRDIFEQGDQTELAAEGSLGSSGLRATAAARAVFQADNTILGGGGLAVEGLKMRAGTSTQLHLGVDLPLFPGVRGGLEGEWSRFSGSDAPSTNGAGISGYDGTAYGGGPTLRLALGKEGALFLGGSALTGTIQGAEGTADSDLSGFFLTLALRWRAGS